MGDVISVVELNGKHILYFDYSQIESGDTQGLIKAILEAEKFMVLRGPGQRTLTNVNGIKENTEIVRTFKEVSVRTKGYRQKGAIIGLNKFQQIAVNAINWFSGSSLRSFNSFYDARDWLASDE